MQQMIHQHSLPAVPFKQPFEKECVMAGPV